MHETNVWHKKTGMSSQTVTLQTISICEGPYIFFHTSALNCPFHNFHIVFKMNFTLTQLDTVRRPLKEAFLASKIVILDYFSRELPF